MISQRERFWGRSKQERLVLESQGCHVGAAQSSLLRIKAWKAIFSVKQYRLQDVWAVALIIQMLDVSDAVNFVRCALNVKLLSRITLRRQGVVLTRTFWVSVKTVGFQVLSLTKWRGDIPHFCRCSSLISIPGSRSLQSLLVTGQQLQHLLFYEM